MCAAVHSGITVPEVFTKVDSAKFFFSFLKWLIEQLKEINI